MFLTLPSLTNLFSVPSVLFLKDAFFFFCNVLDDQNTFLGFAYSFDFSVWCCMSSLFNLFSDINSPGDRQSVGLRKGPEKRWELTLGLLLAVTLHHGLHEKNMLHLFCLY